MPLRVPIAVRLPRRRVLGRFSLARVVAQAAGEAHKRPTGRQLSWFEMSPREQRFARRLLEERPNLWLYRTHQQCRVGDFAVVDMSSPCASSRAVWLVDLKLGAPVRTGGGGAGIQLANADAAVRYLAGKGVVSADVPLAKVTGDGPAMLAACWGLVRV